MKTAEQKLWIYNRYTVTKNCTGVAKDFVLAFPGNTVSRKTINRIVEEFKTGARGETPSAMNLFLLLGGLILFPLWIYNNISIEYIVY